MFFIYMMLSSVQGKTGLSVAYLTGNQTEIPGELDVKLSGCVRAWPHIQTSALCMSVLFFHSVVKLHTRRQNRKLHSELCIHQGLLRLLPGLNHLASLAEFPHLKG